MTDEQRKRIHEITYSTEDRMELAERIVRLEEEIDKQKFKFEVLEAHGIEIVDAIGGGHEIYDTRQREVDNLKYENDKLRELVRKWYPHMARRVGKDALAQWGQLDVLRELGIEVEDA